MASTKKSMTSELNNFIRHEIEAIRNVSSVPKKNSTPDVSATISPNAVVRHAADQLVESLLRDDITAAAAKLTEEKLAVDGSELLKEAESILESSACQLVEDILRGCNVISFDVSSDTNADIDGSGSAPKKSKALVDASSPAPTSFSLFDLMDSKPGFVIPPRITAYQIIKAYQRETKAKSMSAGRNTAEYDGGMNAACEYSEANEVDQDNSTALELLEKAEDIEDLSPDPDSWETVRKILYNGLTTFFRCDGDIPRESNQSRFLKVHKSLHEKCIRSNVGSVVTTQLWGIAQNIVGSLLLFDQQFESFAGATTGVAQNDASISFSMDLYWDLGQQFLECLSHLASDYVQSCVGNENEIERMMLGIGLILQRSSASCLLAAMDPMAGWFEVWSRFIPPSKLMAVVRVSGLGRDLLQRCNPSKNNVGVQKIFDTLNMKNNITAKEGSQDSNNSPLYDDLLHGQFLQSISVLRTIILQCGGSPDIVNLIHGQAVDWNPKHYDGNEEDNIFSQKIRLLESCDYCLSLDDAQTILKSAEEYLGQCERDYSPTGCVDEILKPFLRILHLAKSHPGMVDASVELLCSETVDILQRLQ